MISSGVIGTMIQIAVILLRHNLWFPSYALMPKGNHDTCGKNDAWTVSHTNEMLQLLVLKYNHIPLKLPNTLKETKFCKACNTGQDENMTQPVYTEEVGTYSQRNFNKMAMPRQAIQAGACRNEGAVKGYYVSISCLYSSGTNMV